MNKNYCIYETIIKTKGYLTSYCDTRGNLWIASCDDKEISVYSIYEDIFVKNKVFNYYVQKCLFFELCDKLYIAMISDKTLFIYEYLSGELYAKQEFEICIADVKFAENNIYIVCNSELIVYDIVNKTLVLTNLKFNGDFDVIYDDCVFLSFWNENKICIYKTKLNNNFEFYKNYNFKFQPQFKFYKNANLYLAVSDKNNLKIFDIESEKNNYAMLYLFENKINKFNVNVCSLGKCYIDVHVDNNIFILENYEKELCLINKLKIKKETEYLTTFDFDDNYYIITENLAKEKTKYNNDIEKKINSHLKFAEFYENSSNFDFYVDILFDNKNKLETEFAKMFLFYFEKMTEYLEGETENEDEKSFVKKLLNNNLMNNKLYYDKKFIIYNNNKKIAVAKRGEIICNNINYNIEIGDNEILKDIFIMDNKFYCVVKNNDEILYLPYNLDFTDEIIIKSCDKLNVFCCGKNFILDKESFDTKTQRIYKNICDKNKNFGFTYEKINFDLKHNINTFIIGFSDYNFPRYYKLGSTNIFTIRIKNKNYYFDEIKEDIDKIYIVLDVNKEKIKNKDKKEMIEWIDKTDVFDEFFISKIVCENKHGDIYSKDIQFNPFDLNMIFYNKMNKDANIVIDIFSTEKINFVLSRKNILCSKVLDKTTIKIINFLTKKEYFEAEIKEFYDNLI